MRLTPYIHLMRLEKPIGIWLLFFPASWGVLLSPVYRWELLPLMLLGAVVTRSAGCIINDLTDRELDAQVERTRQRPLASGAVSVRQALVLLALLGVVALGIALCLPLTAFLWSLVALPMIATYPWMKRLTWWPQLFLGLTFNLGAIIGWAATGAPLAPATFLLYAACLFWTLGYDTLYAVQDMHDDARVGIKSSARRVGTGPRLPHFVGICYLLMLLCFACALNMAGLLGHPAAALAIMVSGGLFAKQYQDAARLTPGAWQAGALFRANQWVGLVLLAGLALARAIALF